MIRLKFKFLFLNYVRVRCLGCRLLNIANKFPYIRTFHIFVLINNRIKKQKFEVVLLKEVWDFLDTLPEKAKEKIFYNIDKSKYVNNSEIFKKLDEDIWEFRTMYNKTYYRIMSFWDKTEKTETLVVTTHGIIKKTDKLPKEEIEKARAIMKLYFEQKLKK